MASPDELPEATPPAEPVTDATPAKPAQKRRRWPRVLGWTVAVALLLLVGLVALAPTLVSTGPGTSLVASIAQRQIDGRLRMSGLSVGWSSGVKLKEAVVEDPSGVRVLELANLDTGLTLLDAVRGNLDLGDASLRLSLPTVVVRGDGTTNLDKVFGLDEPSEEPVEIPDLKGSLKIDGNLTVQYLPHASADNPLGTATPTDATTRPSSPPPPPPPVGVEFDGTKLTFGPDKQFGHTVPLALRISATPAGTVSAVGDVDLNSLSNELPTVKEKLEIAGLDVAALSTLLTALGVTQVEMAGTLDGTLTADTSANTLKADFTGKDIAATQRGVDGAPDTGYQTKSLTLAADGGFEFVDAGPTKRPVVTLASSMFATDDLTATLAGRFDPLLPDAAANFADLARDVKLKVDSDFFQATGTGPNLGEFKLVVWGDVDNFQKRFGTLVDFGEIDPAGRLSATVQTSRQLVPGVGPSLVMTYDVSADKVVLTPLAPTGTTEAVEPLPPPLRVGRFASKGNAVLPAESQSIASAAGTFAVTDAGGTTLADGAFSAADLDGETQSIGRASLDKLTLPDYAALRQTLAGYVDLPEPTASLGKIDVAAAASVDGVARKIRLIDPLKATLDGRPLAAVNAEVTAAGETAYAVDSLVADLHLPAANVLAASLFGTELSSQEPADGMVSVKADSNDSLRFNTSDLATTLAGRIEVGIDKARAQGMTVSGRFPVALNGLAASIPADAAPLEVNGGTVQLAGASVDAGGEQTILNLPTPPAGSQLVDGVSINPVLSELLGKYVNPAFVKVAEASGFLDVKIASSTPLNLSDLTGPTGGKAELTFSLREMRLVNPQIKQLTGPYVQQLNAIPGVDIRVPDNLDTLRGNILDARVGIDNGVADTNVTFNVADPRELFGSAKSLDASKLTLYPLGFSGKVDLTTYAAKLNVSLPQSLVEKWWPDDLEWAESFKPTGGANFALGGTTFDPKPAVGPESLRGLAAEAAKNRAADEIEKRLPDEFKGLGDLLRGGR